MQLLEEHNGILDAQVDAFGGTVVKTAGDSYMVDFDSVTWIGAIRIQMASGSRCESGSTSGMCFTAATMCSGTG